MYFNRERNPIRFAPSEFKKYPEGIEREEVKNTPGVHYTQEDMREFVRNLPPIDFSAKEKQNEHL